MEKKIVKGERVFWEDVAEVIDSFNEELNSISLEAFLRQMLPQNKNEEQISKNL